MAQHLLGSAAARVLVRLVTFRRFHKNRARGRFWEPFGLHFTRLWASFSTLGVILEPKGVFFKHRFFIEIFMDSRVAQTNEGEVSGDRGGIPSRVIEPCYGSGYGTCALNEERVAGSTTPAVSTGHALEA